jgi:hypothetical protein
VRRSDRPKRNAVHCTINESLRRTSRLRCVLRPRWKKRTNAIVPVAAVTFVISWKTVWITELGKVRPILHHAL